MTTEWDGNGFAIPYPSPVTEPQWGRWGPRPPPTFLTFLKLYIFRIFKLYIFLNFLNYNYHFKLDNTIPKINEN